MRSDASTHGANAHSAYADTDGLPIGPGSLTWRLFGDRRLWLVAGRIGTLQIMHPAVGAALQDHSNFFVDPWDRVVRSIPPILGVIYDPPEQGTPIQVRDFHKELKGTDSGGRRYHALNPEVFWWTHATFVEVMIAIQEYFGTPLTATEKDQLVAEGITWWQRYGLSMSPVITNYAEFKEYWDRMLDTELESNATTDFVVALGGNEVNAPPLIPDPIWSLIRRPFMHVNVWLLSASMPERGREILGLTWTRRDEIAFRVFATAVRRTWPLLPERVRYFRRAHEQITRQARQTAG